MAAGAEIEQRRDRPLVEERRHGDHERLRRQRARRDHVDVLPGVAELDAGLEQRVDQAVALDQAAARLEPAQDAAERDEADAVATLEVPAGQRRRCAHGALERAVVLVAAARLGEAVEEEDDVGVPIGVTLVDDELAAAGARPPVDRAKAIAGHEGACVGELEAVGAHARHEVAGGELRVERSDEALQKLGARIDLQPVRAIDRDPPRRASRSGRGPERRISPSSTEPQRSQRSAEQDRSLLARRRA